MRQSLCTPLHLTAPRRGSRHSRHMSGSPILWATATTVGGHHHGNVLLFSCGGITAIRTFNITKTGWYPLSATGGGRTLLGIRTTYAAAWGRGFLFVLWFLAIEWLRHFGPVVAPITRRWTMMTGTAVMMLGTVVGAVIARAIKAVGHVHFGIGAAAGTGLWSSRGGSRCAYTI